MKLVVYLLFTVLAFNNIPEFTQSFPETLYMGMENYLPIKMNGVSPEDISVKIAASTTYKRNDSLYVFNPQYPSDDLKIKLYYKNVICQIKTVQVKNMPEANPYFDVENQGFIKISDLDRFDKLNLKYPSDFPASMHSKILYFNIFIQDNAGSNIYSNTNRSEMIDPQALKILKSLTKGGRISINNIIVSNNQGFQSRVNTSKEILLIDK